MITTFSATGTYHTAQNIENQDVISFGKNKNFLVIALADGVSTCSEAKHGAEIAVHAIIDLMLQKGNYFFSFSENQIAELTLSHILSKLQECAEKDSKDVAEYSSTIACVVVDRRSGKTLCLNVGDCIIMASVSGQWRILTTPEHSSNGCCVTTTIGVAQATFVKVFDTPMFESFLICSDGAWREIFVNGKLKAEVAGILSGSNYVELQTFLQRQNCTDDHSFISLDLHKKSGGVSHGQTKSSKKRT